MLHQRSPYPPMRNVFALALAGVWMLCGTSRLWAQLPLLAAPSLSPSGMMPPTSGVSMTPDQTRQSVQWLADQLMQHVPRQITGDDDWGDTKKVWAGVKVRRDGWELKTKRRWQELRHGRWVRYEIELPERNLTAPAISGPGNSQAEILREELPAGDVATLLQPYKATDLVKIHSVTPVSSQDGLQSWRADATVSTPARFSIRVERWNLGAKWYSVEISGKMDLAMRTTLTMGMSADFGEVPPAMQLDVAVEQASLVVSKFEVERISKLGGDAAEEIGDLAEHTIGKVWIRKENSRLVSRLNKAIGENQDSLRWSMADWLAQLAP
ncbi:hypothetical protein [Allorhodopirellula heiligendammensis]|uniref:Uncharacterized protein n=1 Tax=Allorhodopirellula heiligendammensis TaxID=2714739 RepID=A0A5C6BV87_9BACT|nr:hypothetical protein [Allorhodopirellula heiligendammensis]TWU15126.1 hypothetical protein Poly21_23180 [Allorhodopirellula heiligendammensis]